MGLNLRKQLVTTNCEYGAKKHKFFLSVLGLGYNPIPPPGGAAATFTGTPQEKISSWEAPSN